jgi:maleate isomerase
MRQSEKKNIGLIAVHVDDVVEQDFSDLACAIPDVTFYTSRYEMAPFDDDAMLDINATRISDATRLLVPLTPLEVIVFACASGTAALGFERVKECISEASPYDVAVVSPLNASIEACKRLSIERLAVVSPYNESLNNKLLKWFDNAGITVTSVVSLPVEEYPHFGAMPPEVVAATVTRAFEDVRPDAVLVSCTGVRALSAVKVLENLLGVPVMTSNQCMFWAALRAAGSVAVSQEYGTLLRDY